VSVCLSVCLSVHSYISETTWPNFTKFFCMLHVVIAPSFSGGVEKRYVLLVLWMMSCFHTVGPIVHLVYSVVVR